MDLNLNLTGLSPDAVARILAYVAKETSGRAPREKVAKPVRPLNMREGTVAYEIMQYAKSAVGAFDMSQIRTEVPRATLATLQTTLARLTGEGQLHRIKNGLWMMPNG